MSLILILNHHKTKQKTKKRHYFTPNSAELLYSLTMNQKNNMTTASKNTTTVTGKHKACKANSEKAC
jgi:hypothetical protein